MAQVIRVIVICSEMALFRRFSSFDRTWEMDLGVAINSSNELFIVANMFLNGLGII